MITEIFANQYSKMSSTGSLECGERSVKKMWQNLFCVADFHQFGRDPGRWSTDDDGADKLRKVAVGLLFDDEGNDEDIKSEGF